MRTALDTPAGVVHNELSSVYGDKAPPLRTVERWSKFFRAGREDVEERSRPDRAITKTTADNIDVVRQMIDDDPYTTIEGIQVQSGLSDGSVQNIISDHVKLRKMPARYIPKDLT